MNAIKEKFPDGFQRANLPSSTPRLLTDEPAVSSNRIVSLFGQREVVQRLYDLVLSIIFNSNGQNRKTWILAVHGRLGQGKSTVIEELKSKLHKKDIPTNSGRSINVCKVSDFSISDENIEALEQNFDLFFASWRTGTIFISTLVVTLLSILLIFFAGGVAAFVQILISSFFPAVEIDLGVLGFASIFASLAIGYKLIGLDEILKRSWRSKLKNIRFYNFFNFSKFVKNYVSGFPDVIIIDDFDRAKTDQQLAMLWSLRRHKSHLKTIIIIPFDEVPLIKYLESENMGVEVLEKTFDAAFRMPALQKEDSVSLAIKFSQELYSLNCYKDNSDSSRVTLSNHIANLFNSTTAVADLARIFFLHGRASARFAKTFVNNTFIAAHINKITTADDLSALMRIIGMYEYFPFLENQTERFGDLLALSSPEEILKNVEGRIGKTIPSEARSSAKRYLKNTNHMQPYFGNWGRLFGAREGEVLYNDNDWVPQLLHSEGHNLNQTRSWCYWDLAFLTTENSTERALSYSYCEASCVDRSKPPECFSPVTMDFETDFPDNHSEDHSLDFIEYENERSWLYLLDRLRLADREYLDTLDESSRRKVLFSLGVSYKYSDSVKEPVKIDEFKNARLGLLNKVPNEFSLTEMSVLCAQQSLGRRSLRGVSLALRRTIENQKSRISIPLNLGYGIYLDRGASSEIVEAWPKFRSCSDYLNVAKQHFRCLFVFSEVGLKLAPTAHMLWLLERANLTKTKNNDLDTIDILLNAFESNGAISTERQEWRNWALVRIVNLDNINFSNKDRQTVLSYLNRAVHTSLKSRKHSKSRLGILCIAIYIWKDLDLTTKKVSVQAINALLKDNKCDVDFVKFISEDFPDIITIDIHESSPKTLKNMSALINVYIENAVKDNKLEVSDEFQKIAAFLTTAQSR